MADDLYLLNGKLFLVLEKPRTCPDCKRSALLMIKCWKLGGDFGGEPKCLCCANDNECRPPFYLMPSLFLAFTVLDE